VTFVRFSAESTGTLAVTSTEEDQAVLLLQWMDRSLFSGESQALQSKEQLHTVRKNRKETLPVYNANGEAARQDKGGAIKRRTERRQKIDEKTGRRDNESERKGIRRRKWDNSSQSSDRGAIA
jgi:hypothetical protein